MTTTTAKRCGDFRAHPDPQRYRVESGGPGAGRGHASTFTCVRHLPASIAWVEEVTGETAWVWPRQETTAIARAIAALPVLAEDAMLRLRLADLAAVLAPCVRPDVQALLTEDLPAALDAVVS